jgi:hypothetical protein
LKPPTNKILKIGQRAIGIRPAPADKFTARRGTGSGTSARADDEGIGGGA